MEQVFYLISDAARQVSVESHVLRYWEEELNIPIKRNELGHRYYTEEDVERFRKIKMLKEQGLQLKAIRMILKNGKLERLGASGKEKSRAGQLPDSVDQLLEARPAEAESAQEETNPGQAESGEAAPSAEKKAAAKKPVAIPKKGKTAQQKTQTAKTAGGDLKAEKKSAGTKETAKASVTPSTEESVEEKNRLAGKSASAGQLAGEEQRNTAGEVRTAAGDNLAKSRTEKTGQNLNGEPAKGLAEERTEEPAKNAAEKGTNEADKASAVGLTEGEAEKKIPEQAQKAAEGKEAAKPMRTEKKKTARGKIGGKRTAGSRPEVRKTAGNKGKSEVPGDIDKNQPAGQGTKAEKGQAADKASSLQQKEAVRTTEQKAEILEERAPELAGDGRQEVEVLGKGEMETMREQERQEKTLRLQLLLRNMIADAVKDNNRELCEDIKETMLKELDYQFRVQEEKADEREQERLKREDEHFKKIDELLRNRSGRKEKRKKHSLL